MHGCAGQRTIKIMLYNSKVLLSLAYISWFICQADARRVHCPNFVTVLLGMRWAATKYIQEYKVTTLSLAISICRNCTGILFSHILKSGYMLYCNIATKHVVGRAEIILLPVESLKIVPLAAAPLYTNFRHLNIANMLKNKVTIWATAPF